MLDSIISLRGRNAHELPAAIGHSKCPKCLLLQNPPIIYYNAICPTPIPPQTLLSLPKNSILGASLSDSLPFIPKNSPTSNSSSSAQNQLILEDLPHPRCNTYSTKIPAYLDNYVCHNMRSYGRSKSPPHALATRISSGSIGTFAILFKLIYLALNFLINIEHL